MTSFPHARRVVPLRDVFRALGVMLFIAPDASLAVVVPNQVDDFEALTTLGWRHGAGSPVPPDVVADGGPNGAGDAFLRVRSTGSSSGAGSALITFNTAQWAGDYSGIESVQLDLRNLGASTLHLRLGLVSAISSSTFVSTQALVLEAGSNWMRMAFALDSSGFTRVTGAAAFADLVRNVTELRVLSAEVLNTSGDRVLGTFGVDNVNAVAPVSLPGTLWLLSGALVPLVARQLSDVRQETST